MLGIVTAVVASYPGVISSDNNMGAAIILADDRVQNRFARPAHAHREIQQAELGRLLRVFLEDVLVAAHPREVIEALRCMAMADGEISKAIT